VIELLEAETVEEARRLAELLDSRNRERQQVQQAQMELRHVESASPLIVMEAAEPPAAGQPERTDAPALKNAAAAPASQNAAAAPASKNAAAAKAAAERAAAESAAVERAAAERAAAERAAAESAAAAKAAAAAAETLRSPADKAAAVKVAEEKAAAAKAAADELNSKVAAEKATATVRPLIVGGRPTAEEKRWALEQLPKGKIVLEAPKTMKVGEFRDVYANVGIDVDDKLLRRHTSPTDQSIDGTLAISGKMSAVLTGSGFKIKNTTPEEQDVTEGFVTVWNWEIEARQDGEQELEATLYVTLPGIARQRINSFSHKIGVVVRPLTWPEWFNAFDTVTKIATPMGTAITVIFGWFGWTFWRRKKNQFSQAFPPRPK